MEKIEKREKKKRGSKGVPPETAKKMFFYMRALIGNREAIDAKKTC